MKIRNRKVFFLCSTARRGLHGGLLKDDKGHDGIEVSAGFEEAAERMSGDDNRPKPKDEPKPKAGEEAPEGDDQGGDDQGGDDDAGDDGEGDDQGGDEGGDDPDEKPEAKEKKRNTAAYVREVKRELREEKRARAALEQRLAALENGGLPKGNGSDNSSDTSEAAPDPNDATKYPLGVLDDGYITDKIAFETNAGIARALEGRLQTEREQAEAERVEQHMAGLREKVDELTEIGSDLYDDFEEVVLNDGLAGKWKLTETTFTAAAEAENGAEILYALANDKKEALRVSQLSVTQQVKYVLEKDAEISGAKPKPRTKPRAETPPAETPRGRGASNPIRPDTDNLDDFRKIFYKK